MAPPEGYAELLVPLVAILDIWETVYLHLLPGEDPVVEWTSGTGLRPLLAGRERNDFLADYSARVHSAYPQRDNGPTIFPFRRLFIVATR